MDMILKHGNNATEIIYSHFHLFFSYETPVAAFDPSSKTIYITDKKYSRTTTAHDFSTEVPAVQFFILGFSERNQ